MIDYNNKMWEIINGLNSKPKLLLHSCCAPCSSAVIDKLRQYFEITVLYYNPNIFPFDEYSRRLTEQCKLLEKLKICYIIGEYQPDSYFEAVSQLKDLPEGSLKCKACYAMRMKKTAELALKDFDYFCTTLSVSPHKNSQWINEIGENLEKEFGIKFLFSDFKKENGYLRSLQLSKEYNLYRQNYCGCTPKGD